MRDDELSSGGAEPSVEAVPEGMPYLGDIQIRTDEILIWVQPDGARCFGFMPAHN